MTIFPATILEIINSNDYAIVNYISHLSENLSSTESSSATVNRLGTNDILNLTDSSTETTSYAVHVNEILEALDLVLPQAIVIEEFAFLIDSVDCTVTSTVYEINETLNTSENVIFELQFAPLSDNLSAQDSADFISPIVNTTIRSSINFTIINPVDRTKDGYYRIKGDITHVFPFLIKQSFNSQLIAFQTGQGMQDFSMKLWISLMPLDETLFTQYDSLNPAFLLGIVRTINFMDKNYLGKVAGALPLDPFVTYYANVKNLASRENSYRLLLPT